MITDFCSKKKREGRWEKKTTEDREITSLRVDCGLNLAKTKRLEKCTG